MPEDVAEVVIIVLNEMTRGGRRCVSVFSVSWESHQTSKNKEIQKNKKQKTNQSKNEECGQLCRLPSVESAPIQYRCVTRRGSTARRSDDKTYARVSTQGFGWAVDALDTFFFRCASASVSVVVGCCFCCRWMGCLGVGSSGIFTEISRTFSKRRRRIARRM